MPKMQKATMTFTVSWYLAEEEGAHGEGPTAAAARAVPEAMGQALKDHIETLSFGREITNLVRDDHRMDGYVEIADVTVKGPKKAKNPSSVEEKSRRRDRVAKGRKKKAKGRKKRSLAMQRALRGT